MSDAIIVNGINYTTNETFKSNKLVIIKDDLPGWKYFEIVAHLKRKRCGTVAIYDEEKCVVVWSDDILYEVGEIIDIDINNVDSYEEKRKVPNCFRKNMIKDKGYYVSQNGEHVVEVRRCYDSDYDSMEDSPVDMASFKFKTKYNRNLEGCKLLLGTDLFEEKFYFSSLKKSNFKLRIKDENGNIEELYPQENFEYQDDHLFWCRYHNRWEDRDVFRGDNGCFDAPCIHFQEDQKEEEVYENFHKIYVELVGVVLGQKFKDLKEAIEGLNKFNQENKDKKQYFCLYQDYDYCLEFHSKYEDTTITSRGSYDLALKSYKKEGGLFKYDLSRKEVKISYKINSVEDLTNFTQIILKHFLGEEFKKLDVNEEDI